MTQRIVILGATSAIAEAAARRWAGEGASLLLTARSAGRLDAVAADLRARGAARVETAALDLAAAADHRDLLGEWADRLGGLDIVLLAYGTLGDQTAHQVDPAAAATLIATNFTSAAAWCEAAAARFAAAGRGTLLVIGSVAGDRGRRSNYLYGATKAGLGVLVQGIAHRLAPLGARAVLIKPGFVDTPMTAHVPNRGGPLWASADKVAAIIVAAGKRGGPVVYAPGLWALIMAAVRNTPAPVFNKINL